MDDGVNPFFPRGVTFNPFLLRKDTPPGDSVVRLERDPRKFKLELGEFVDRVDESFKYCLDLVETGEPPVPADVGLALLSLLSVEICEVS